MTKRERLSATIAGQPVDRLPVSLWRHFYCEETTRAGLVAAMLAWQKTYDWDFLKINPRAGYHAEDWGNRYAFSGNGHIEPALVRSAVRSPEDFGRIARLDPAGKAGRPAPVLADHLGAVADLRKALGPDEPMLMTVFTPMSVAAELAGGPQGLAATIVRDPAAVHAALRAITDTYADFAARTIDAGADGIFLATTHCATRANFTDQQYAEFGRPYDLEVLAAVRAAPLNLLHVCRAQAMVRELADYPVAMLNWDTADPTNPPLALMARAVAGKALAGGLDRKLFTAHGGAAALATQAQDARAAMAGRPFVLASTCTIDARSDPEVVKAVRESVDNS